MPIQASLFDTCLRCNALGRRETGFHFNAKLASSFANLINGTNKLKPGLPDLFGTIYQNEKNKVNVQKHTYVCKGHNMHQISKASVAYAQTSA
jgi:hypothetical protein